MNSSVMQLQANGADDDADVSPVNSFIPFAAFQTISTETSLGDNLRNSGKPVNFGDYTLRIPRKASSDLFLKKYINQMNLNGIFVSNDLKMDDIFNVFAVCSCNVSTR